MRICVLETCNYVTLHRWKFLAALIVGTVKGGGMDCLNKKNLSIAIYNKVPFWVDYIRKEAKKHDEQLCISDISSFG